MVSAHIGFDRALGYGLKYSKGFGYTHLGRIGNAKKDEIKIEMISLCGLYLNSCSNIQ